MLVSQKTNKYVTDSFRDPILHFEKTKAEDKNPKTGKIKNGNEKDEAKEKKIIKEKKKSEGVKDEFKYSHLWLAIYSHMSLPHLKQ